ncbi:hypothetical protein L107_10393 [Cyanobium sp. Copco_Reservoir_LC18]|jgi:hypothetical protein|uniref:hypothetical protein n=1 Tax=Cyanobium sp. Copco_Reservoir_LC18 TaxID=1328305 RepID=UPI00135A466C|nr:hypothetical protein [Cyanobium sp. Copco_Reservoir_LC18]KAF0653058.1 hypothetical protein L107_10393 [Cyanobium sp. Copco_Reservoir_LC18]
MTDTKGISPFDSEILADRLAFMAIALFVIYLISLLASIVPVSPLDTAWQLRFISACLDSGTIPLVALGLLHLAAYLNPGNPALQKRRDAVARWAVLAVIGFLLIIPLQAFAGWNSVATARANVARQLSVANGTFDLLQETITTATSLDNLQARLQAIQTPSLGIRFEDLGLPLPETKRAMLARLKEVREQVEARIQAPAPQAVEAVARDSLRVMLSSFALAIAFAMGAQRKGQAVPLLVEWHTALAVRGPRAQQPEVGGLLGLPLPGRSAGVAEEAYFSRLVPEEDDSSEADVPPPP